MYNVLKRLSAVNESPLAGAAGVTGFHEAELPAGRTPAVSIRIAQSDLARARAQAARRGLRYQTYLKMLLHEALDREEKAASG
jgi:hypothetical protein